jgi:DNA polymerase-3 subunit beta
MGPGVRVTVAFATPEAAGTAEGSGAGEPRPAEGMISFEGGGRRLTARLIGGDFIRYQSRFPAEFGCRALLPAEQFTAAVRRVSLVADRASSVRLTFSSDQVVVEAQTAGRARAAETVRATFTGVEPAIAFNPAYLLDGLAAAAVPSGTPGEGGSSAPEPGRVQLEFTSPAKPALITWSGYDIAETGEDDAAEQDDAGESGDGEQASDATPAFRYLVVPLRSAGGPGRG